jgi:hypothetical protein
MISFYDVVSSLNCIASNDDELERMQMETAMAQFEVMPHISWRY